MEKVFVLASFSQTWHDMMRLTTVKKAAGSIIGTPKVPQMTMSQRCEKCRESCVYMIHWYCTLNCSILFSISLRKSSSDFLSLMSLLVSQPFI